MQSFHNFFLLWKQCPAFSKRCEYTIWLLQRWAGNNVELWKRVRCHAKHAWANIGSSCNEHGGCRGVVSKSLYTFSGHVHTWAMHLGAVPHKHQKTHYVPSRRCFSNNPEIFYLEVGWPPRIILLPIKNIDYGYLITQRPLTVKVKPGPKVNQTSGITPA